MPIGTTGNVRTHRLQKRQNCLLFLEKNDILVLVLKTRLQSQHTSESSHPWLEVGLELLGGYWAVTGCAGELTCSSW